jgi:hypothetical protein
MCSINPISNKFNNAVNFLPRAREEVSRYKQENKEEIKMKKIVFNLIIIALGLFLIIGCEKDTTPTSSDYSNLTDQELVEQSLLNENDPEFEEIQEYLVDWGIDDGSEANMYNGFSTFSGGTSLPKILSPIENVIRFGRKINQRFPRKMVYRRISEDSIAVNVERVLVGRFYIFGKLDSSSVGTDSFKIYTKPLTHRVRRNTIFIRRTNDEIIQHPRRRWRLAAISLGDGISQPVPTVEIHQLTVESSGGTSLVFIDPLGTMLSIPDDLPTFTQGEEVTITTLVSNSSANPVINATTGATETVLLHFGFSRIHRARKQFQYMGVDPSTGYHIYQGQWTVHEPACGAFHAVVDVIDNGTIYDDDAEMYPYNSATWGCPYRVVSGN